ncbi:MAG: KilA-N domain-containing protein, partial [Deltaproteobacteria bacterium]|nr:KilA-N domain-containing protein [Deltaproteobacteria bacterium]
MGNKFEIVEVNSREIMVDVSLLMNSDILFFNATKIAGQFGKKPSDWLKTDRAKEYISIISRREDIPYGNLVNTKNGGKYQGTWLHNKLAIHFARWCSVEFEYDLDKWIIQMLKDEHDRKQKRLEAKTGYLQLSQAVEGSHDPAKFYHYSTETNMINKIVLGLSAKKYKKINKVDNIRDNCTILELNQLDELQKAD